MNDRQITLRLIARSGLHVGAGAADSVTDALVRRDASGQAIIPGTSLAGALRALATRLAPRLGFAVCAALKGDSSGNAAATPCGCEVCSLFGDVNPAEEQRRATGGGPGSGSEAPRRARAGRLWVYDAWPVAKARRWVRGGVGIERQTGTAYRRGRTKFDLEALPPGLEFDLRLEIQTPDGQVDVDREERLLAAVLSEWVAGRGAVGGRASRGLGALAVRDGGATYRKIDLADPTNLLDYIAQDDPWRAKAGDDGWLQRRIAELRQRPFAPAVERGAARAWAEIVAEVQFAGPMLVNDPALAASSGFDHGPFSASGDFGAPTIPGASLKGVLRGCGERIARTLSTRAVWRDAEPARRIQEFLARCPACDPLVGRLEWAAEASGGDGSRLDPGAPGAIAAMTSCDALLSGVVATTDEVADRHLCLACRLFGSPRRGSRLRVEDASLVGELRYKAQDFLAIDRFTGGGADRRKFDALVLWRPRFRVRLFLENPAVWELGWLLLSLRDVADGLAPIGFGAAKGFGWVESADWTARIGFLDAVDFPGNVPPEPWVPDALYTTVACTRAGQAAWRTLAAGWVESFVGAVRDFRRADSGTGLPRLMADSYFTNGRDQLYPVEALDGSLG